MAAPSNIRINPFIGDGGTTNYVNFIENILFQQLVRLLYGLTKFRKSKIQVI